MNDKETYFPQEDDSQDNDYQQWENEELWQLIDEDEPQPD
jgi:hypothetical protein